MKAGRGSQQLREILIPGEDWTLVAEGYRFTEGPAANAKGEVFFNDIPNSKAYKIGLDGKVSLFLADTKRANGQAFGPDGRLYAVATGAEPGPGLRRRRQAHGDRRGHPRQRPGRPPRRRHLRHATRTATAAPARSGTSAPRARSGSSTPG